MCPSGSLSPSLFFCALPCFIVYVLDQTSVCANAVINVIRKLLLSVPMENLISARSRQSLTVSVFRDRRRSY